MGKHIITATLMAAGAITLAPPAHAVGEQITYTVRSDSSIMSVNYFNQLNDMTTEQNLSSQWQRSFTGQATYQFASMSAQTSGTQVACQISVNGSVRDTKSASGRYAVVVCSASV